MTGDITKNKALFIKVDKRNEALGASLSYGRGFSKMRDAQGDYSTNGVNHESNGHRPAETSFAGTKTAIFAEGSPGDVATLARRQDGTILASGQRGGRNLLDEVESVEDANRLLKGLPLSQANLLTFDLMPIGPLLPLGMLMKAK